MTMPAAEWDQFWNDAPGLPNRECTEPAPAQVNVRSGDFIAGNFADYITAWHQSRDSTHQDYSKLYYVPMHPTGKLPLHMVPLTITAQRIDPAVPPALTYTFPDSAWSDVGYPFYATGTVLPEAGTWKVTAQAGNNWGCFVLKL
ncbi:MAG: hypothetical protein JOZ99_12100 [Actinobacteria bacterium]|nr:hypothetical protein [Actinomycetota bacterium]